MKPRSRTLLGCFTLSLLVLGGAAAPLFAGDDDPAPAKANAGFTLDEALQQLRLYPKDAYLQYVALQLARRENRVDEIAGQIFRGDDWARRAGRREDVDLFSIFTGALAVQESLQLDTMRGGARGQGRQAPMRGPSGAFAAQQQQQWEAAQKALEKRRGEIVDVASLIGPGVKSHPWEEMLGSRKPDIGPLARKVPEDFFFAEFGSLSKLLDVLDSGDLWSKHLLHQTSGTARSQQVADRVKRQLVVETNRLLRSFYDLVVEEVALTGSDLFFNEGSDLTLLFRFKQPVVFKTRMDGFLQTAEKADAQVKRTAGKSGGIDYVHLTNADRTIHVYSAYPEPNLHVRSNSLAGFERVLDAIRGKTAAGQAVQRLGDTSEFAFIRTLMPRGSKEEDGFLYLSDPFIRKLVGPGLKLTERRRVLCYNHLRMIGHASLMHRGETGSLPESLEALEKSQCSPGLFGTGELTCPDGGKYTLSADGTSGICSHHGHCHDLVPCLEHPVAQVTGEEADEYNAFLTQYNQYWRTFFDPIGIRIKASPEQYRLETIVLPLIDNTVYTGLAMALGGKPEPLDALPVPQRNIMSLNFRIDKEGLAEKAGLKELEPAAKEVTLANNNLAHGTTINNLRQLGLAMHNYLATFNHFPASAIYDDKGKPLLSWRVMLLPYLDQAPLYNEFHLNEAWDSEHNKKLISRIPQVYRSLGVKANKAGQTTYLAPVGKNMIFTGDKQEMNFASIPDGLVNTILLVQADEDHAVPWTSPQDLTIDLKKPAAGLVDYPGTGSTVLFVDGSAGSLRQGIPEARLAALFTRNGNDMPPDGPGDINRGLGQQNSPWFLGLLPRELAEQFDVPRLILKGLGNQAGLHIYDAPPTFDFNLPAFLGESLGSFSGRGGMLGLGSSETLTISFLIASLNAPVYISVAVQDASIVDEFLNRLDGLLAAEVRVSAQSGWFQVQSDFYRVNQSNGPDVRCASLGFGPLKFRIFWARIGNALYIASKPFILDDLAVQEAAAQAAKATKPTTPVTTMTGPAGHALFRIRSRNWKQVLPDFRLGWAENNRRACLDNLGPLSSVARAVSGADQSGDDVCLCADHLHATHFFCPEGGHYELAPGGKSMMCSVHGTALAPHQDPAPGQDQSLGKLLSTFAGLEATLTFLEDGLHAVVTIDRK